MTQRSQDRTHLRNFPLFFSLSFFFLFLPIAEILSASGFPFPVQSRDPISAGECKNTCYVSRPLSLPGLVSFFS